MSLFQRILHRHGYCPRQQADWPCHGGPRRCGWENRAAKELSYVRAITESVPFILVGVAIGVTAVSLAL